jgi:hypothetical protein
MRSALRATMAPQAKAASRHRLPPRAPTAASHGNQALLRRLQGKVAIAPASAPARVSRKCAACEEEGKTVQAKRAPERLIALASDEDTLTSAAPVANDPAPAPEPSPAQGPAEAAQPDAGQADVAQPDAGQPDAPQTDASPEASATEAAPDAASPDAASTDAALPDVAQYDAQVEQLKAQVEAVARYQAPAPPGRTETAGATVCDLDSKKPKIVINTGAVPTCLLPCVQAHEQAHVDFQQQQCENLGIAWGRVMFWLHVLKQFVKENNAAEAQRAATQLEGAINEANQAVAQYNKFMDQTCRFDEGTAYQAGIEACDTDDARKRCATAGQTDDYNKQMAAWRRFMQNPPNCPAAPAAPATSGAPAPSAAPAPPKK